MEWQGPVSKMASSNFLDDVLNTEADESAVSALVGSLESQLTSSTSQAVLADANNSNVNVNVNSNLAFQAGAVATAAAVTLAGNGGHATQSCTTPQTSTCNISVPATASSLQLQNTTIHSMLPNGNAIGLTGGQQQFGGNSLPNGTVVSASLPTMTTISGLVIPQSHHKVTGQQQPQQMIIPAKTAPPAQQQQVLGANGAATSNQVLRPAASQIQQQQTMVNSGGGVLPAGVQVVNMNTVRGAQNVQNVAALSNPAQRALAPRVVLGQQQVVAARPGQVGITLQALQGFQAAGAQGHLLVKTETGQYQLLRVGPGPVTGSTVGAPAVTSSIATMQNLATVAQNTQPAPVTSAPNSTMMGSTVRLQVPASTTIQPLATQVSTAATAPSPAASTPANNTTSSTSGQMTPDTAKVKCKNFLATLLRLASEQPESVATNVRLLIQGLVDAKVEPEEFTTKLQRELNSSPQPCLIPFLKKSLPYLRHSLATRELEIKGILPPALSSVPVMAIQQQQQQNIAINRVTPVPIQGNRPTVATATMVRGQTPGSIVNASTSSSPAPRPTKVQPVSKAPPKQPNKILQQPIQQQQTSRLGIIKTENNSSTETPPISFTITLPQATTTSSSSASIGATATTTPSLSRPALSTAAPNVNAAIKGSIVSKEKKAANFSSSLVGLSGDDDINDVAAMGGVNLAEETQQILGSTEMIGTQIRSCKDENFLFTGPLLRKIQEIASKYGLGDTNSEVVSLISHATQERLKTLLEKLAVIAEHRNEAVRTDPRYEVHQDIKAQLKFLEELDKLERRRHSEMQREMLLKAAKSRSKAEDPEQAKLKAKAKEMQRAETEELRQREANMTALRAIGTRKKPKLDLPGSTGSYNQVPFLRPRVKRVNLRDLLFLLEEEKRTARSPLLYKAYLK